MDHPKRALRETGSEICRFFSGRNRKVRWHWPCRFRIKVVLMKKRLEPETPLAYN